MEDQGNDDVEMVDLIKSDVAVDENAAESIEGSKVARDVSTNSASANPETESSTQDHVASDQMTYTDSDIKRNGTVEIENQQLPNLSADQIRISSNASADEIRISSNVSAVENQKPSNLSANPEKESTTQDHVDFDQMTYTDSDIRRNQQLVIKDQTLPNVSAGAGFVEAAHRNNIGDNQNTSVDASFREASETEGADSSEVQFINGIKDTSAPSNGTHVFGEEQKTNGMGSESSNKQYPRPPLTNGQGTSVSSFNNPENLSLSSGPPNHNGHGAPSQNHPQTSQHTPTKSPKTPAEQIKLAKDISRLKATLATVSVEAAQRVLRENWRTFIFDQTEDDHVSFIARACLKNATPSILDKVLKDGTIFKEPFIMAASQKPEFRRQVFKSATAAELTRNSSTSKIDKMVAERLKDAPPKKIVYWLAAGDRLGYSFDDVVLDNETVVPYIPNLEAYSRDVNMGNTDPQAVLSHIPRPPLDSPTLANQISRPIPRPPLQTPGVAPPHHDALLAEQEKNRAALVQQEAIRRSSRPSAPLTCDDCDALFDNYSGLTYHNQKKVCKKTSKDSFKWTCDNCLQGFTTKQGMEYHILKGVCRGDGIAPATAHPAGHSQQQAMSTMLAGSSTLGSIPPSRTLSGQILPGIQIPSHPPRPNVTDNSVPNHPHPSVYDHRHANAIPPNANPYGIPAFPVGQGGAPRSFHKSPSPPTKSQAETIRSSSSTLRKQSTKDQSRSRSHHKSVDQPDLTPSGRRRQMRADDDVRGSPDDLAPERLKELNRQLQDADDRYEQGKIDIPADWTEAMTKQKLTSLKNANASRKSQIRKAFGVTLRLREKDKVARQQRAGSASSTSTPAPSARSKKERKSSDSSLEMSTSSAMGPPPPTVSTTGFSPINQPPRSGTTPTNGYTAYAPARPSSLHRDHRLSPPSNTGTPTPQSQLPSNGSIRGSFSLTRASQPTVPAPPPAYRGPYESQQATTSNKRRRESIEHERRPAPNVASRSGYLAGNLANSQPYGRSPYGSPADPRASLKARSEGAATPVSNQNIPVDSRASAPLDTNRVAGTEVRSSSNTIESAIALDSSSDEADIPAVVPAVATATPPTANASPDDTEDEEAPSPSTGGDDTEDEEQNHSKRGKGADVLKVYTSGHISKE